MFPGPLLNGDRLAESGNARWKQKLRTTAAITGENYHQHESLTEMWIFFFFFWCCVTSSPAVDLLDWMADQADVVGAPSLEALTG